MYAKLLVPDHWLSLVVPRSSPEVYGRNAVSLIRRGAYRARDGPRPSAEGARHCPSGHGGKGEATLSDSKMRSSGPLSRVVLGGPAFFRNKWSLVHSFFRCLPG